MILPYDGTQGIQGVRLHIIIGIEHQQILTLSCIHADISGRSQATVRLVEHADAAI